MKASDDLPRRNRSLAERYVLAISCKIILSTQRLYADTEWACGVASTLNFKGILRELIRSFGLRSRALLYMHFWQS